MIVERVAVGFIAITTLFRKAIVELDSFSYFKHLKPAFKLIESC